MSTNWAAHKDVKISQPVLMTGIGNISLGKCIEFGFWKTKDYFSSYCYLEARDDMSEIILHDKVKINNNFSATAFNASIEIGENTVIGPNCTIVTSDFHGLDPSGRDSEKSRFGSVTIGKNVFIGTDVTILRGVSIGENSVIGAGSIVIHSISKNSVCAGNPAKVIRKLNTY